MFQRFLIEAIVVGLMVMLVGLVISYSVMFIQSPGATKDFEHWKAVAVSFAVSGMVVHGVCEASGINGWYCDNGNACRAI